MRSPHKRRQRRKHDLTLSQLRRKQGEAKEQREYELKVVDFKLARPDLLAKSSR